MAGATSGPWAGVRMGPPEPPKPDPPPSAGARGSDIYQLIGRFQLIGQAVDFVRSAIPTTSHSILCSVTGGPSSDIRRLWYLCVSVVYGRFRNRIRTAFSYASQDAIWDITGKAVSLELNYSANSIVSITGGLDDPGSCAGGLFARGPEQLTIGGGFNGIFAGPVGAGVIGSPPAGDFIRPTWFSFLTRDGCIGTAGSGGSVTMYTVTLATFDGAKPTPASMPAKALRELPVGRAARIPPTLLSPTGAVLAVTSYPYQVTFITPGRGAGTAGAVSAIPRFASFPALPDDGRIVTTPEKHDTRLQPPKPTLDGHTRSSYLSLVAAALQEPCYLPEAPPCTMNNAGQGGVFVTAVGEATSAAPAALARLWARRDGFDNRWPLGESQGPDGYRLQPPGPVPNYGG